MAHLLSAFHSVRQNFENFFFRKEVPYGMALMRICLSAVMLYVIGRRWRYTREFYSAEGAPSPIALSYGYPDWMPLLPGTWAVALFTILLILLFTLMIGWKTRVSAAGVFLLYTYFTMQDSLSTLTKYSVITSHGFLLLSLSQCGAVWSVDRLLELKKQGFSKPLRLLGTGRAVEIWPQRLAQLCIAIVYFGAAVTKLQTPTYFSGDQMRFWLLTNVNHWNPLGELLSLQPAFLVPMMYFAVLWEISFLLLVWKKQLRVPYLLVGAIFHLATTITLGLIIFPLVCISIYLAFVTESDVIWWRERMTRFVHGTPSLTWLSRLPARLSLQLANAFTRFGTLGFASALLCLTATGLLAERSLGVYADYQPEKKVVLEPMPRELARTMLRTDTVIREQDKVFSFDIGKYMLGGLVVETNNRFRAGKPLYAQVNLIPPHGDMFLECLLVSEQGLVFDQSQGIATRESFRYTFNYLLPESLEAGKYQFILKLNNQEVARKTIEVTSR